ncbi:MarC family protein [Paraburkholderia sp. DHOC27]|uniref:MarC family protein n=1 Tax=Paraburkholderia sp. DHOC27 TaxID=2303330 RepID=UPI000E3D4273|nr:MarC family protein [Paraburkholderia sp. DHOC27]RFU45163.1 NAAT family transporter [Paraburkholderia sp. DHOC27]
MVHELTKTVLLIVASLFPIINPPATAFIILSLVPHATPAERAEMARRIAINSLVILLACLSIGAYLLSFLGISIPVLRVAGGIVIAVAGWNLLQSSDDASEAGPDSMASRNESWRNKIFYPLTLPVTVGPGAISVAIALGTGSPREGLQPVHFIGVGLALAVLCVSIYVCVRFAGHIARLLGTSGTQVAMRLFAFAIFCIGVQILWLGLSELLNSLHLH